MMDCERYAANVFEVIDLINRDYPRGGIALPGLTAGTCLRKDFAFSEERSHAPGMLLAVSRVNESVPLFLVEGIKRRLGSLSDRKVAVLGLAFKADTDDERDSLAHKLIRLLERELADVAVHDPHVPTPTASFEEAVDGADAVVVAANHSEFRDPRTLAAIVSAGAPTAASWSTPGTAGARARCSRTPPSWHRSESQALGRVRRSRPHHLMAEQARVDDPPKTTPQGCHESCARHRRRRHDRRCGRKAPAGRPGLRGARLRPASRAAVDARGLRGPHRRPARAGRGQARDATGVPT